MIQWNVVAGVVSSVVVPSQRGRDREWFVFSQLICDELWRVRVSNWVKQHNTPAAAANDHHQHCADRLGRRRRIEWNLNRPSKQQSKVKQRLKACRVFGEIILSICVLKRGVKEEIVALICPSLTCLRCCGGLWVNNNSNKTKLQQQKAPQLD